MRRLLWFGAGAASAVWVRRKAQATVRGLAPDNLGVKAVQRAKARGSEFRAALVEGRSAMHDREEQLRAELRQGVAEGGAEVRQLRPTASPGSPPWTTPSPGSPATRRSS